MTIRNHTSKSQTPWPSLHDPHVKDKSSIMQRRAFLTVALAGALAWPARAFAEEPTPSPESILRRVLDSDPWGFTGAEVSARAIVREGEKIRTLAFEARSSAYAPPLTRSIVRFTAPADIAGFGFLQIQKPDADDERYLYLPQMQRARRISGALRAEEFMGTDFTYADLDRRDLRDARSVLLATENLGKYAVYKLEVRPNSSESAYSKLELWVRTDNFIPLKWALFNKAGAHVKTLRAKAIQRVQDQWFITTSLMQDHVRGRTTELILDSVVPRRDIPAADFTVQKLEQR